MPLTAEQKDKLEAFRAEQAKRESDAKDAAEVRELAMHELRALMAEGGKKVEGKDFVLIDNPQAEHLYALRKPDSQGIVNWRNADKAERLLDADWLVNFLRNYVPASSSGARDKEAGIEWSKACGAAGLEYLIFQTARAFAGLLGATEDGRQKK